ncbi:MAG TPA: DUF488 domain-containing protein [Nitrospira sp.]|nr:DUF488 domain-containing protein [Nitrospira sp.]
MSHILWTIGHSTRPIDKFVALLNAHHIQQLVDIRTIPRSRYNPQFNTEALAHSLADATISYQHVASLGGLRKPKKDSINTGWRNDSFRGYADYMQTGEFWRALEALLADSREQRTAIMCAEAVPWRCHRSLIADAFVTRGYEVQHVMSETKADLHQLTSFARVKNGLLHYPEPTGGPSLYR